MIELEVGGQVTNLHEVGENSDEDALEIRLDFVSDDEIKKVAAFILSVRHWWLNRSLLKELGDLQEMYKLRIDNHTINLYNFFQPLSQYQLDEAEDVFGEVLSHMPRAVNELEDVIISGQLLANGNSGEPMNGDWISLYSHKAFRLFPAAFDDRLGRVTQKVSHFSNILTHELTHPEAARLRNLWAEAFGWRYIPVQTGKPRILPGGWESWEICDQEERCVTEYAKGNAREDICESFVAYVYEPSKLDKEKNLFLASEFPHIPHSSKLSLDRLSADQMGLPKLPMMIPYVLKIDSLWD